MEKFGNINELKKQISKDVVKAKALSGIENF